MGLVSRSQTKATPFLKWAGGKGQLLEALEKRLPWKIQEQGVLEGYVEPFVGGGAFFFFLQENYGIKEAYLLDKNRELVVGYQVVKNYVEELIAELKPLEEAYLQQEGGGRKPFYYQVRNTYNQEGSTFDYTRCQPGWIRRAAQLIFLNRTCFNGLFRLNKKGEFNVPHGRYKRPRICDDKNLQAVNRALQGVTIIQDDFCKARDFIHDRTFVYLDPPFRPLSRTASFTHYSGEVFNDAEQLRLYQFFQEMDERGAHLMLSNSDPKNQVPGDDFFDGLYQDYEIQRVKARRSINRDPAKRGPVYELIIRNYG